MRRWLLLLGSNLPTEDALEGGCGRIARLGTAEVLAGSRFDADDGSPAKYANILLELRCGLARQALLTALKAIEADMGRRPGSAEVAVDIDLLAEFVDAWRLDNAAAQKGELRKGHVQALLRMAGLNLVPGSQEKQERE